MKNKLIIMLVAAIIVTSFFAVPSMAEPKQHFENMVKELNLTPEQAKQLKALREGREVKETHKANREKMMSLRKKVVDEFANENYDKSKIDDYNAQILALMKEGINDHTNHMMKLRSILTPEQFKKFHELREKQFKKMMLRNEPPGE